MAKILGYVRVSSEDQAASGLGLEAQEATLRTKWPGIHTIYRDEGLSGSRADRPGLLDALDALEQGDTLVVAKRDRLSRDLYLMLTFEKEIAKAGAILLSADGTGNGADPAEEMFRNMVAVIAQYERQMIRARTRSAMQAKRARGEKTGGHVPFGYRIKGFRHITRGDREVPIPLLEEDPVQQAVIRDAVEMREGGSSLRTIARCLDLKHPSTVSRILKRHEEENVSAG